MVVNYLVTGVTPSNKTQKIKLQLIANAYKYKVGGLYNVYVQGPLIDKISITVPVADKETREKIQHSLVSMAGDQDEPQFEFASVVKTNYAHAINCTPPGANDKILIQVVPKKITTTGFLRFEFNPTKIGGENLAMFKELLFELSYTELSWADVIKAGRVTRLDVAIDMINAPTSDLLIESHVPGKSHVYFSQSGNVETSYVGLKKPGKASDQKVYDKLQEETDKNIDPGYSGVFRTRVEITLKAGNQKLSNLEGTKNLFKRITVIHPGDPPKSADPLLWTLYLDSCRFRGIDNATALIPNAIGKNFQAQLETAGEQTWQPEKIWSRWAKALEKTGLLS